MECLHYSSQIISVCVFSLFLYEMEEGRKEGRKEGRRLLIWGFFFSVCVFWVRGFQPAEKGAGRGTSRGSCADSCQHARDRQCESSKVCRFSVFSLFS
jgi:hypothetical protein